MHEYKEKRETKKENCLKTKWSLILNKRDIVVERLINKVSKYA